MSNDDKYIQKQITADSLAIIFIALKLFHVIDVSWWWLLLYFLL